MFAVGICNGKIKFRGEILEGQHEAIIDEETWNKVQRERQKRSTKNVVSSTYLLTGLVYCGKCGAKMRYQKWGKDVVKMYCYSQQRSKPNLIKDINCDNDKVDACDIEEVVITDLFKRTENIIGAEKKIDFQASATQVLKQKYDVLTAKIKRLYNLYAADGDKLLLDTINENKLELAKISEELDNEKKSQEVINEINEKNVLIRNLKNTWGSMSIKEQQRALRMCIDRIEINGSIINIHYNF